MTTITLEDLAAKKAKPSEGLVISDHMLDLTKFTGSELRITGKGTKRIGFMNAHGLISTPCEIDYPGTNNIFKFDGTTKNLKLDGTGGKLLNAAGNSISQAIYFVGVWSDIELCGFYINQRREFVNGVWSSGAAGIQFQGVTKEGHNLGNVYVHDIVGENIGAEGLYGNHFTSNDNGKKYVMGETLTVERVRFNRTGRDPFQQQGFRKVEIKNCSASYGGLQNNTSHCSGLSMNDGPYTESILVKDCAFDNVPQLAYLGEGPTKALFEGVHYVQGNAMRVNQSIYSKVDLTINSSAITAPNVLIAAITADGAQVELVAPNTITAPKLARSYNGGSVIETIPPPIVKEYTDEIKVVETTTFDGIKTFQYFYRGQELIVR